MDLAMNAQIQEADVTDINLQTKDEMKPPPGEANALAAVIPLEGSESERISMLRDSPFLSRRGFGLGVILLGAAGVSSGELIPFHRKASSKGLANNAADEIKKVGTMVVAPVKMVLRATPLGSLASCQEKQPAYQSTAP